MSRAAKLVVAADHVDLDVKNLGWSGGTATGCLRRAVLAATGCGWFGKQILASHSVEASLHHSPFGLVAQPQRKDFLQELLVADAGLFRRLCKIFAKGQIWVGIGLQHENFVLRR